MDGTKNLLPIRPGCFPMTVHAFCRLRERWPETVLVPADLDNFVVPLNSPLIGYDQRTSARFLEVPGTPMIALVVQGIVRTFLSRESARYKLYLRGWWFGDGDFLGPAAA